MNNLRLITATVPEVCDHEIPLDQDCRECDELHELWLRHFLETA